MNPCTEEFEFSAANVKDNNIVLLYFRSNEAEGFTKLKIKLGTDFRVWPTLKPLPSYVNLETEFRVGPSNLDLVH